MIIPWDTPTVLGPSPHEWEADMTEDLNCAYCGCPIRKGEPTMLLSGVLAHWETYDCIRRLRARVEALEERAQYVRPQEPIALGGRHYEIKSGGPNEDE